MRNKHHPGYQAQLERDLEQAEGDLESLLLRAEQALPVLVRCAEDVEDWRKDIRGTIAKNMTETIESTRQHQKERKHDQ